MEKHWDALADNATQFSLYEALHRMVVEVSVPILFGERASQGTRAGVPDDDQSRVGPGSQLRKPLLTLGPFLGGERGQRTGVV